MSILSKESNFSRLCRERGWCPPSYRKSKSIIFFRQMIPNFANIAFSVTQLSRLFPKCKTLPWTDESIDSINKLKQAYVQCPTLKYPSSKVSNYSLVTDSSNHAVGAALYQCIDETLHPISFFSKKLSQTQKTYSIYDRELLAVYLSVLHLKTLIDGHVQSHLIC